jgi:membrane protease YdiL (CAAX protease family)
MEEFLKKWYFKFIILPLIFIWVSFLFTIIFGTTWNSLDLNESYQYLFVYVTIFAFFEEIIFRYVIQWTLWQMIKFWFVNHNKNRYLWTIPIVISSILFTFLHKSPGITIFFLSFFLWIVYYYYNSIILNIYIHILNNFIALSILYFYV